MKLDLLKKLVKLANSNPNEHEANAAARQLCRMLEKDNFSITTDTPMKNPVKAGFGSTVHMKTPERYAGKKAKIVIIDEVYPEDEKKHDAAMNDVWDYVFNHTKPK